jgi:hypothetical protein
VGNGFGLFVFFARYENVYFPNRRTKENGAKSITQNKKQEAETKGSGFLLLSFA